MTRGDLSERALGLGFPHSATVRCRPAALGLPTHHLMTSRPASLHSGQLRQDRA